MYNNEPIEAKRWKVLTRKKLSIWKQIVKQHSAEIWDVLFLISMIHIWRTHACNSHTTFEQAFRQHMKNFFTRAKNIISTHVCSNVNAFCEMYVLVLWNVSVSLTKISNKNITKRFFLRNRASNGAELSRIALHLRSKQLVRENVCYSATEPTEQLESEKWRLNATGSMTIWKWYLYRRVWKVPRSISFCMAKLETPSNRWRWGVFHYARLRNC